MSDPNYADVSLLLHFDGADGSTVFTDSSSNALSVTANGNAQLDTSQKKFGTASGYFDGSGDYLTCTLPANFDRDFTIEGFYYPESGQNGGVMLDTRIADTDTGGILIYRRSSDSNRLTFGYWNGSSFVTASSVASMTTGQWWYYRVKRVGNTVTVYLDGVTGGSCTASTIFNKTGARIGASWNGGEPVRGWLDEMRITANVARSGAAVPAAPFPNSAGPTINTQPTNQTVSDGDTATFTVSATGTGTLTYQWKNGDDDTDITGETSATYDFTAALADNGNTYYVTVTDDDGSADSDTVTLTVSAATTYTPTLADANKVLRFTAASPEVTIPTNASVAYPVNTILTIRQAGTGTLSLVTTGLTINGTVPSWAQHVEVQFRKVGTDEWDVT